jgi:peptide/nickel transport system ATP-binding protein
MALLEARGLGLQVPDRSGGTLFGRPLLATLFRDIDLRVEPGESLGIVGESGSGKTSLARTLLRLYRPTQGRLHFAGRDITHLDEGAMRPLRTKVQAIFQDPLSSLNPRHRIGTLLAQPLLAYARVPDRKAGLRQAAALLERVGLPTSMISRFPHELSGGQRQRVGIARAIALKPDLIVADEIVSGLDVSTQAQILALLRELKSDGSLVFISHDLSVVRVLCDRVLVMREGAAVESGPCAELFANPARAYTRSLLEAIPLPEVDPGWVTRGNTSEKNEKERQNMKIAGSVALVTGANRGVGRAYVEVLLAQGAKKVYAAARDTNGVQDLVKAHPGKVEAVKLDVTSEADAKAAAAKCKDVSLLVNNAGANGTSGALASPSTANAEREMAVNYFGVLYMTRAFGPVLKANGGGAIVNMLSVVSRVSMPLLGTYSASKAAAWSLTQATRGELKKQGTLVVGVFPGAIDTDMAKGFDLPKLAPADVASLALKAVETGNEDVDVGDMAVGVAAGMKADPKAVERDFGNYLPG